MRALSLGETQEGSLASSSEVRYYLLNVLADQEVTLDLTSDQFDTHLGVYRTNQASGIDFDTQVERDDDGGEGTNARIKRLLASGFYVVTASARRDSGDFKLQASGRTVTVPTIAAGETKTRSLSVAEQGVFILRVSEDGVYTLDLSSDAFDPSMVIYETGNAFETFSVDRLASDIDGGEGNDARIQRPLVKGDYIVQVSSFFNDATGAFTLKVTREPDTLPSILPGETKTGTLLFPSDQHYYLLEVDEPGKYRIDLTSEAFDPDLDLFDTTDPLKTDRNSLDSGDAFNDGKGKQVERTFSRGRYLIRVGTDFSRTGGAYTLQVSRQEIPVSEVRRGGRGTGSLAGFLGKSYFTLTIAEADTVWIEAASTEFDPWMFLYRTGYAFWCKRFEPGGIRPR
jgi:hypothetical protein